MPNADASYAVLCSYLGLTARDLADIGNFSERFARDLLAGRRSFPKDVQIKLVELLKMIPALKQVMMEQADTGEQTVYIHRSREQLLASHFGKIWPEGYLGPYRVAAFQAAKQCSDEGRTLNLEFASWPDVQEAEAD